MALSTFTELKDAVADWLDRSDLTTRIPDFITLAESRLNRDLRIRPMEVRSTMTTTAGNQYFNLPGGYIQMRNIQLNTNPTASTNQPNTPFFSGSSPINPVNNFLPKPSDFFKSDKSNRKLDNGFYWPPFVLDMCRGTKLLHEQVH